MGQETERLVALFWGGMLATRDEVWICLEPFPADNTAVRGGLTGPRGICYKSQSGTRRQQCQPFLCVSIIEDLFIFLLLHTQENDNNTRIRSRMGFVSLEWYRESEQ